MHIFGRIVAFFVPTAECTRERRGENLASGFQGPACSVLIKRYPAYLFGGLYVVDSSAIKEVILHPHAIATRARPFFYLCSSREWRSNLGCASLLGMACRPT